MNGHPLTIHWAEWLLMAYSLPSMVLYCWLIYKIFTNRSRIKILASPFFDLIVAEFINDLLYWFFIQFGLRFPRYYILPFYSEVLATLAYASMLILRAVLYLGHIPFAMNRLILYTLPIRYEHIWTRKTVVLCFLLEWSLPLAVNVPFFLTAGGAVMLNKTDNMLMSANLATVQMNTIQALSFIPISAIICSISFGISLSISSRLKSIAIIERRLLICSILQATPMLFELTRSVVQFVLVSIFNVPNALNYTSMSLHYYMDLTCTIQPWCLLATNKIIRKLLFGPRQSTTESTNSASAPTLPRVDE